MSPARLRLVEDILAVVREEFPLREAQCHEHPKCKNRVTWVYPYRGGGFQRYFCDEHLPKKYTDVHTLAYVDLYRLLDQLDALEAEERRKKRAKPATSRWNRIKSG